MKRNSTIKSILAGAAIAGILTGGIVANAAIVTKTDKADTSAGLLDDAKKPDKGATHGCAGKNACKGKGGCKTGDAGCAGKNSCKGKGGCAMKDGKPAHK